MAEGRGVTYRVVLLGELGVGKTSLFKRIKDNTFNEFQPSTTGGIDSCTKSVTVDKQEVILAVWDTAGVERFRTMTRNYYRNADVAVLLYSVTDTATLHYLYQWLKDTELHAPKALKVIIGNKIDREDVEVEEGVVRAFAESNKIKLVYRISCKTNEGISNMISELAEETHRHVSHGLNDSDDIVNLSQSSNKEDGGGGGCSC